MPESTPQSTSRSLFNRPFILVALGFGLGYLARFVLGPPAEEQGQLTRDFHRPLPTAMPELELPLDRIQPAAKEPSQGQTDGAEE